VGGGGAAERRVVGTGQHHVCFELGPQEDFDRLKQEATLIKIRIRDALREVEARVVRQTARGVANEKTRAATAVLVAKAKASLAGVWKEVGEAAVRPVDRAAAREEALAAKAATAAAAAAVAAAVTTMVEGERGRTLRRKMMRAESDMRAIMHRDDVEDMVIAVGMAALTAHSRYASEEKTTAAMEAAVTA
ncbi:unnamed protein product, partial [Laminaria digitata]